MKKIALLTLLLINLSLSFSLPRNQASPAIFSVTKTNNSILFRHTDSTLTAIPCQSVASIVSNADPSKIVSVWVVQQGDYDKIMQFDYLVCGFSSKSDAVDSLTAWAICDTVGSHVFVSTDSATVTQYNVLNSQNTPPVSPSTGDVYLVGTVPTGAWVGQAKDIAEWNGSAWVFTDGVQGDFLYNATTALTYIFRSGNWVQTTGIPALNNGNTISSGLRIGTNNARSLTFETNNVNRGRFDSVGRFYVYDTSLRKSNKYLQIDSITGRLVASEISGGGGTLQTLSVGTNTLTISGGNTVDLNRKVDSLYLNTTNDSTIYLINGTRHAIPRGALTFAKNSAGDSIVLTVSGVRTAVKDSIGSITPTSTTTFTNKRITARVDSTTSSATPTINTDNVDTYKLTAQAADITSFTTNLSGTPTDDQILHIVIIGTATRAITWGSKFEASTVALPTTTVGTDRLDVYFIWNTATSKWRCGGTW